MELVGRTIGYWECAKGTSGKRGRKSHDFDGKDPLKLERFG